MIDWRLYLKNKYKVTLTGEWESRDVLAVVVAVGALGQKLQPTALADTAADAFTAVYGPLTFNMETAGSTDGWSCRGSGSGFSCTAGAVGEVSSRLVVHELGHTLNAIIVNKETRRLLAENPNLNWADAERLARATVGPYFTLGEPANAIVDAYGNWVTGRHANGVFERTFRGYSSNGVPDVYHGSKEWGDWNTINEDFADMYLNWIFNSFTRDGAGAARYNWMTTNIGTWVSQAMR